MSEPRRAVVNSWVICCEHCIHCKLSEFDYVPRCFHPERRRKPKVKLHLIHRTCPLELYSKQKQTNGERGFIVWARKKEGGDKLYPKCFVRSRALSVGTTEEHATRFLTVADAYDAIQRSQDGDIDKFNIEPAKYYP